MMTKKTQHDLVVAVAVEVTFDPSFLRKMTTVNDLVVVVEVMIDPSSLWKMQKTRTTVNDLVVAVVEVTIYSASLWKTQKKNPS